MKELSKRILKRHLASWKRWIIFLIKYHPRITKGSEWRDDDEQAYKQIEQLISQSQERQVDKKFIDEKAKAMRNVIQLFTIEARGMIEDKSDIFKISEDFIRSIVSEIQKPQKEKK